MKYKSCEIKIYPPEFAALDPNYEMYEKAWIVFINDSKSKLSRKMYVCKNYTKKEVKEMAKRIADDIINNPASYNF